MLYPEDAVVVVTTATELDGGGVGVGVGVVDGWGGDEGFVDPSLGLDPLTTAVVALAGGSAFLKQHPQRRDAMGAATTARSTSRPGESAVEYEEEEEEIAV